MRAACALLVVWAGLATAALYRLDQGRPTPLDEFSLAADIRDPLLALIVGLLDVDAYGGLSPAAIDSVVRAHGGSKLPYREVTLVDRRPRTDDARARVDVALRRELNLPVPYSILGYNPGSMLASQHFALREWWVPDFRVRYRDGGKWSDAVYRDVQLFGITEGWMRMDVDWWLDKLLGGRLDDTQLVGVALVHREGARFAVAFGYTAEKQGRTGVFDLAKDEVVFPAPRELLALGRALRSDVERRLAAGPPSSQAD
jgi:hypothetical protein